MREKKREENRAEWMGDGRIVASKKRERSRTPKRGDGTKDEKGVLGVKEVWVCI